MFVYICQLFNHVLKSVSIFTRPLLRMVFYAYGGTIVCCDVYKKKHMYYPTLLIRNRVFAKLFKC